MASFKAVVKTRRKNGEWPVYVRLTHNRRTRLVRTGLVAVDSDLRKKEIHNGRILDQVNALIKVMRERVNAYGVGLLELSVDVVERIATRPDTFDRNFLAYCRHYVETLEAEGRGNTATIYRFAAKSLEDYVRRDFLDYSDITSQLMTEYLKYLRERGKTLSSKYFNCISTMFKNAKRELNDPDSGTIRIEGDPFFKVKADKMPMTRKKALPPSDIVRIMELPDEGGRKSMRDLARDVFLLSFYLVGMNAVDLYSATHLKDGYLEYERTKTKTRRADRAFTRIQIQSEAVELMEKYKDPTGERVFNFHRNYSTVHSFNAVLGRGCAAMGEALGIEGLTMYAARHSWATIAVNDCGIDIYTVEKALIHKPVGLAVTEIYIKPDYSLIDKANRRVLDVVVEASL